MEEQPGLWRSVGDGGVGSGSPCLGGWEREQRLGALVPKSLPLQQPGWRDPVTFMCC